MKNGWSNFMLRLFSVILALTVWFFVSAPRRERVSERAFAAPLSLFGLRIESPTEKYLFCLGLLIVFAVLAKNLVRSHIGREWMAIRDMDVAAPVIGNFSVSARLA